MVDPSTELVEVVDEDGVVERIVTRAEMRAANLRHRNIAVFVVRPDGRLVVHQRADWKDVYPSLWDVAFGGVPGVGERDLDAAVRELAEEAGVEVEPAELRLAGRRSRETDAVRWVGTFYVHETDAVLHPADGEVQRMETVAVAELQAWADAHPLCPDVVPLLADLEAWLG